MQNSFLSNIPAVTKNLIIINFIVWLAADVLGSRGIIDINSMLGLHYWISDKFNPVQLLTYMFLHGSFGHIFFNMFALFMFGVVIERFWGSKRFLIYYLVCGIGAGIVQEVVWTVEFHSLSNAFLQAINSGSIEPLQHFQQSFTITGNVPVERIIEFKSELFNTFITVGASGAVFGILLAFGWFFPHQKIYLYFLIPIPARIFVILYGILELFFGVANFQGDSIAHFAHLGGLLFGLILILLWRKKTTDIDNFNGY